MTYISSQSDCGSFDVSLSTNNKERLYEGAVLNLSCSHNVDLEKALILTYRANLTRGMMMIEDVYFAYMLDVNKSMGTEPYRDITKGEFTDNMSKHTLTISPVPTDIAFAEWECYMVTAACQRDETSSNKLIPNVRGKKRCRACHFIILFEHFIVVQNLNIFINVYGVEM